MSGSSYSITYDDEYVTLCTHFKGKNIPLVSSTDRLQVKSIYHNILVGQYKNVRELCEDIHNNFKSQATLLVLATLISTAHLSTKV